MCMKRLVLVPISGPRTTGDGYYESCILDPEGNQIEITADTYLEFQP